MAVLGKRSRNACAPSPDSASSRSTRAKRRSAPDSTQSFVIANDDQENRVTSTIGKRKRSERQANVDLDDLSLENTPPHKRIACEPEIPQKVPSTPRHRDNRAKIAITPRHRIGLLSRPSTPQSARTPITPRLLFSSVYNEARKVLRANQSKVIGRENEKEELKSFISKRFNSKSSGCVYVSGPPGTGKSALVTEILREIQEEVTVQSSYCNCMSIKSATDIFAKLFDDFGVADIMKGTEMDGLKKVFHSRKAAHLVILDEIDHLLDVDMELMYQLFEWSLQISSSLVLVGIANALDLTDRFLPRLKAKNMRPHLVPFMPYSVVEISTIITSKLKTLIKPTDDALANHLPFIHPTAIQFLAKKVAAQTGDIRKAFAICLRALDIIEAETQATLMRSTQDLTPSSSPSKTPLSENRFLASPSKSGTPKKAISISNPMTHLTAANAPRVTIAHMARVTATAFSNGLTQRLAALNLQQKAALCALSALENKRRETASNAVFMTPSKSHGTTAPTLRMVYDAYSKLCKQDNVLQPLSASEFRDVLISLETLSLVSWVEGKSGSLAAMGAGTPSRRGRAKGNGLGAEGMENQKIASSVGNKELKASLSGAGSSILLAIMDGDIL